MKKSLVLAASIIFSAIMTLSLNSCSEDSVIGPDFSQQADQVMIDEINSIPLSDVNLEEEEELLFMREEEKLARDVYVFLFEKWNQKTFQNISKSENQHMNAIKILIDKYGLLDPVGNNPIGVFSNPDLQSLYNLLISQGSVSLVEGLKVGAAIEEIDILDLDKAITNTDNEDFKIVYENLRKGSENHLRAFVEVMGKKGENYAPQYLSLEEYNRIIH